MSLIEHSHPGDSGGDCATPAALSLGPQGRGAQRFTLLVRTAKLVVDDREYLCVLRDASATGVKLRLFHPMPQGDHLALELTSGERHPMTHRWQDGDHAGFQFDAPIDVRALIDDRGDFPKRQIRVTTDCDITMCAHKREFAAVLRNISQQGACLETAERLMLHETGRIQIPGFPQIIARIAWRDHPRYGAVFEAGFGLEELARMLAPLQKGHSA